MSVTVVYVSVCNMHVTCTTFEVRACRVVFTHAKVIFLASLHFRESLMELFPYYWSTSGFL